MGKKDIILGVLLLFAHFGAKNRDQYDLKRLRFVKNNVLMSAPSPFFKIFEKFEKFKIFFIPWPLSLDKNSLSYWKIKISENAIFLRDFWNFHLQVWVRWGCAKPFFQQFSKSSKNLEYFSYLDPFHSTKTRWDIGSSKTVKNPYFCQGGGVLRELWRFWVPTIILAWYIYQKTYILI